MQISASRLRVHAECPRLYFHKYLLGVGDPGGIPAMVGTAVHAAAAARVQGSGDPVAVFREEWTRLTGRPPIGPDYAGGVACVEALEEVLPRLGDWDAGVLAVEQRGEHYLTADGLEYMLVAIPDLIFGNDREITIVDWKTGWKLPTHDEHDGDRQVAIYAMAASILYPGRAITTAWAYLRHRAILKTAWHPDTLTGIRSWLDGYVALLVEHGDNEAEYPATPNANCAYCPVQGTCPELANLPAGSPTVDAAACWSQLEHAKNMSKYWDTRKSALGEQMKAYLDEGPVELDGRSIFIESRGRRALAADNWYALATAFGIDDADQAATVSLPKAEAMLKRLPPHRRADAERRMNELVTVDKYVQIGSRKL